MSVPTATSDDLFQMDVLDADRPVIVDFWAEWCGPCKAISPFLEALASEKPDAIKVVKLNIDHNPGTPTQYGVRGIPTLMMFKNGQVAATRVGAMPKQALYSWVEDNI